MPENNDVSSITFSPESGSAGGRQNSNEFTETSTTGAERKHVSGSLLSLKEKVEAISKLGVLGLGACYAVGLLIVNLYLRQYNISQVSLIEAEYVAVGALWMFLMGLTTTVCFYAASSIRDLYRDVKQGWKIRFADIYVQTVVTVLLFIGLCGAVGGTIKESSAWIFSFTTLKVVMILIATVGGVGQLAWVTWEIERIQRPVSEAKNTKPTLLLGRSGLGFSALIFVTFMIGVYAKFAFPSLSSAHGGGERHKVSLVISSEEIEPLKNMGFQISPENRTTGPVELIFEGSDSLIILPPDSSTKAKAIRVKKEFVDTILYLSDI